MQKVFTVFALLGLCSLSLAMWESIGPYGGQLNALRAATTNNDIIYVASMGAPSIIMKSIDAGNSWTKTGEIPSAVYRLEVDPTDPDILYAGCDTTVFKSTDGGSTWVGHYVADWIVMGLAIHQTSTNIIYAGSMANIGGTDYVMGFYKSTDAGVSWDSTHLSSERGVTYCVLTDPNVPENVYAGGYYMISTTYYPCVFKSTDGGESFTDISNGLPSTIYSVYSLAAHATNPDILFAGTYQGVYKTTDGGGTWSLISPASYRYIQNIATTQANESYVYAGGDTCIYISTNEGGTWTMSVSGLGGRRQTGVQVHNNDALTAYACNDAGFYKSTNAGAQWYTSNYGMNINGISSFTCPESSPALIYTSFAETGFLKSTNNGSDWTMLPTPVSCGDICAFATDFTDPDIVFGLEGLG